MSAKTVPAQFPRVLIEVQGGVVQSVRADDPNLQVYIVDHDDGNADEWEAAGNEAKLRACASLTTIV